MTRRGRDRKRNRRRWAGLDARIASCGKHRYTSRAAAEAAAELKARLDRYPDELRTYYHHQCRGWHITSEPRRPA